MYIGAYMFPLPRQSGAPRKWSFSANVCSTIGAFPSTIYTYIIQMFILIYVPAFETVQLMSNSHHIETNPVCIPYVPTHCNVGITSRRVEAACAGRTKQITANLALKKHPRAVF